MKEKLTTKQKEIFDVSVALFAKKGYSGSSMRDIAEIMDIKAASLYSHIKSKEEIFDWICADIYERFQSAMDNVISADLPPKERFLAMVRGHLKEVYRNVNQYDIFYTNLYRYDIELKNREFYAEKIQNYIFIIESIITDYINSLKISPIIEKCMVVKLVVNIINNFFRWKSLEDFDPQKDIEFLHHMFLYGVTENKPS